MNIQAVLQVVDKIPTIATQLKIIAAVKATRQGGDGKQNETVMYAAIHVLPHLYTRTSVWAKTQIATIIAHSLCAGT